jgi:hypothetical protein
MITELDHAKVVLENLQLKMRLMETQSELIQARYGNMRDEVAKAEAKIEELTAKPVPDT